MEENNNTLSENPPFFDLVGQLRAMRRLKPDPIAEDDLCYIVEAATMACSPGNSQPWKFLIVTEQHSADRQLAVKPAPSLIDGFADKVGLARLNVDNVVEVDISIVNFVERP